LNCNSERIPPQKNDTIFAGSTSSTKKTFLAFSFEVVKGFMGSMRLTDMGGMPDG
jgi:hypothetical protein